MSIIGGNFGGNYSWNRNCSYKAVNAIPNTTIKSAIIKAPALSVNSSTGTKVLGKKPEVDPEVLTGSELKKGWWKKYLKKAWNYAYDYLCPGWGRMILDVTGITDTVNNWLNSGMQVSSKNSSNLLGNTRNNFFIKVA